jgi:hypothetical protein
MTANEEAALEELVWEMTAPHTQEEIAARLGIASRTVRRIEVRALAKLRDLVGEDWEDPDSPPAGPSGCSVFDSAIGADGRRRSRIPDRNGIGE